MSQFKCLWDAASKPAPVQLEIPLDDARKTLRVYKGRKFRAFKHQRGPMAMDTNQVKWAALKHTNWFATLRTNALLKGGEKK
jgi:hypothetical protein